MQFQYLFVSGCFKEKMGTNSIRIHHDRFSPYLIPIRMLLGQYSLPNINSNLMVIFFCSISPVPCSQQPNGIITNFFFVSFFPYFFFLPIWKRKKEKKNGSRCFLIFEDVSLLRGLRERVGAGGGK